MRDDLVKAENWSLNHARTASCSSHIHKSTVEFIYFVTFSPVPAELLSFVYISVRLIRSIRHLFPVA